MSAAPEASAATSKGDGRLGRRGAAAHALTLTVAVLVTWYVVAVLASLVPGLSHESRMVGGMWGVVAAAFVYREGFADSRTNALSRLAATGWSFVLTLGYLLLFPFTPLGLAIVVGLGAVVVDSLHRPQDSVTTSITSAVVLVVAGLGPPSEAWTQPVIRLVATLIGGAVGLAAARVTRRLLSIPRRPTTTWPGSIQ